MKTFTNEIIIKPGMYLFFYTACIFNLKAQSTDSAIIKLSLNEAIRYAKEANKLIEVFKKEERAIQSDLEKDRHC